VNPVSAGNYNLSYFIDFHILNHLSSFTVTIFAESKAQRAESKEQSAKSKAQRAKRKEQSAKSKAQRAKRKAREERRAAQNLPS
jgi:F0F1-type ATP synthase epsilon subunit